MLEPCPICGETDLLQTNAGFSNHVSCAEVTCGKCNYTVRTPALYRSSLTSAVIKAILWWNIISIEKQKEKIVKDGG